MLRPLALALVAFSVLAAGCDSGEFEAQRLFEDEALLSPVTGITRVEPDGTVLSEDPNDWRIGPAYRNRVTLLSVPTPNPVRVGQGLQFLVDTQGVAGGLRVVVLSENPTTGALDLVAIRDPGSVEPGASAPGFYSFTISASQIALGVPGLYRLILLDGSQGIVTYGDVDIRG